MAPTKKTKKTTESINNRLALVMKSGKYTLGFKTVLRSLRSSKGEIFIVLFFSDQNPKKKKFGLDLWFWDWSLALRLMNRALEMNADPNSNFSFHFRSDPSTFIFFSIDVVGIGRERD
ncbi:60S ribosomal protein L30 [Iris pallida]|uniref:60S ribosomal protein L30 n=1 Tax=Iris pallida TaxID=29817 RepID=A0AAX6HVB1_IRIPA|nr:60S ribosomal protein L30 [Iris pallida]